MCKILEVNVDDLYNGGVFSLIKNVIIKHNHSIKIDIAAIEKFQNEENIHLLERHGTSIFYVGRKGNKIVKQFFCYYNLKKILLKNKYDCVHIHGDVSNKLLVSGLAAKKAGVKKIIMHSHASGIDGNHRVWKGVMHKLCRYFLKGIGTDFVACSNVAAKWMYPNISTNKIKYIYNGIDLEQFKFDYEKRLEIRSKLGLDGEMLIGHIGRYAYQKNHDFLLKVFRRVLDDNPIAKLILIGTGVLEEQIRYLAKQYHMEKNIIFYGASSCVEELLQAMDVFVLPSHFEGFPIVGVEAQANGIPVICSEQITRELKVNKNVAFLPIGGDNIGCWKDKILEFSICQREDAINRLKEKKLDIADTIEKFVYLYMGG